MLLKIKNYYYHQQKEITEQSRTRFYCFKHLIEVLFMIIFALRIISCLFVFKCKCYYEPFQEFMSNYTGNLFQFYLLLLLMLDLLAIEGKYFLIFSDTNNLVFQISYSINVINIEQINSCILVDHEINTRFKHFFQIFLQNFYLKHQWLQHIPKYISTKLFGLMARFQFISQLKHIDQDRLKELHLPFVQHLTLDIRAKFYLYYLILNKISYYFHLIIS